MFAIQGLRYLVLGYLELEEWGLFVLQDFALLRQYPFLDDCSFVHLCNSKKWDVLEHVENKETHWLNLKQTQKDLYYDIITQQLQNAPLHVLFHVIKRIPLEKRQSIISSSFFGSKKNNCDNKRIAMLMDYVLDKNQFWEQACENNAPNIAKMCYQHDRKLKWITLEIAVICVQIWQKSGLLTSERKQELRCLLLENTYRGIWAKAKLKSVHFLKRYEILTSADDGLLLKRAILTNNMSIVRHFLSTNHFSSAPIDYVLRSADKEVGFFSAEMIDLLWTVLPTEFYRFIQSPFMWFFSDDAICSILKRSELKESDIQTMWVNVVEKGCFQSMHWMWEHFKNKQLDFRDSILQQANNFIEMVNHEPEVELREMSEYVIKMACFLTEIDLQFCLARLPREVLHALVLNCLSRLKFETQKLIQLVSHEQLLNTLVGMVVFNVDS